MNIWSRWMQTSARKALRTYLQHQKGHYQPDIASSKRRLTRVIARAARSQHSRWAPGFLVETFDTVTRLDSDLEHHIVVSLGASPAEWAPDVLRHIIHGNANYHVRLDAVAALGATLTGQRYQALVECTAVGDPAIAKKSYETLAQLAQDPRAQSRAKSALIAGLSHAQRDCRLTCAHWLGNAHWLPESPAAATAFLSAAEEKWILDESDATRILRGLRDQSCAEELWTIAQSRSVFAGQAFTALDGMDIESTRFAEILSSASELTPLRAHVVQAVTRRDGGRAFTHVLEAMCLTSRPGELAEDGALDALLAIADVTTKTTVWKSFCTAAHEDAAARKLSDAIRRLGVVHFRSELISLVTPEPSDLRMTSLALRLLAEDAGATLPREVLSLYLRRRDLASSAAAYLATHPDPGLYELLVAALEADVRCSFDYVPALVALGTGGEPRVVEALLNALQGHSGDETILAGLRQLGLPDTRTALLSLVRAWKRVSWEEPFLRRRGEVLRGGAEYSWAALNRNECSWIGELLSRCRSQEIPAEILLTIRSLPQAIHYHYTVPYPGDYDASRQDDVMSGCVEFSRWKETTRG